MGAGSRDGIFLYDDIIQQRITANRIGMQCSIQHLTYNYNNPEKIKQLNLSSASNIKIYRITHLDSFLNLRVLILSNNMICQMEGFDNLQHLRVLNLEFNRIKIVQATERLSLLQELHLAYNEVDTLGESILCNQKLRVLNLAYNDIQTLESISVLYRLRSRSPKPGQDNLCHLPSLTNLSLYGNPITSAINYLSFFKMLIPSLRVMDQKSVEDDLITIGGSVCPQEEVLILREAINKLLDQRNQAVQQLENYVGTNNQRQEGKQQTRNKVSKDRGKDKNETQLAQEPEKREKVSKMNKCIIGYLESAKEKYMIQLKNQREKISKISQLYTENLKKNRERSYQDGEESPIRQDLNDQGKSPASICQGWLESNKEIIQELKIEDEKLQDTQQKIININKALGYIESRQKNPDGKDVYKVLLEMVLFGYELRGNLDVADCQKLCKKYLIKSCSGRGDEAEIKLGLIQYSQILKKIIFGEQNERTQRIEYAEILKLKDKIRKKGLLEIIAQLKQFNTQQQIKFSKFEKQKQEFVEHFEKQSEQLSAAWDQLKKDKQKYEAARKRDQKEQSEAAARKQQQLRKKYKIVEEEERTKITELKRAREKQEIELESLNNQLSEAEEKLNRKFVELQEFQIHFNQFIGQKQHIKSLQEEITEITKSLHNEKLRYESLADKTRQLTLQEGILQNKVSKADQLLKQKQQDLSDVQVLKNEAIKLYEKYKTEVTKQSEKLRDISVSLSAKIQQFKDYEKMNERTKKNLTLLEEKVRNIEQMEQIKKVTIKQLEEEIRVLKEDKQVLSVQTESLEKNMEAKREELMRWQLKIQENRLAMSNLSDINKSISDMMIRQSELKRSIIQLEIENKNLVEMKNNLVDDFRIKSYL